VILGTSLAGYVGIVNGMRPGAYGVGVNSRRTSKKGTSTFQRLWKRMTKAWPVGYLVREVLESTPNYSTAVSFLATSALMAPCYITVCGGSAKDGVLITRDREKDLDRVSLETRDKIVLNHDHQEDLQQQQHDLQSSSRLEDGEEGKKKEEKRENEREREKEREERQEKEEEDNGKTENRRNSKEKSEMENKRNSKEQRGEQEENEKVEKKVGTRKPKSRQTAVLKRVKGIGATVEVEDLWEMLEVSPVRNEHTLYRCIIHPRTSFCETRIADEGQKKGAKS